MGLKILLLVIAGTFITYLFVDTWSDQNNDKLEFKDRFEDVSASIVKMQGLMQRFPQTYMVNYFVDNDGFLYLNNTRIARREGAEENPRVRKDMVFKNLNEKEIDIFFRTMDHLSKNGVVSCHQEKVLDNFLFSFGESSLTDIMVVRNASDTTNSFFANHYKILDKKGNLILIKPEPAAK